MEHYFSTRPTSQFVLKKIKIKVRGRELELFTSSGIFSKDKIDFGTKLLVEKMVIKENDTVLDLGSGIGILGIIASFLTKNKVFLVDINERACRLAKMNTASLENAEVRCGNMLEPVKELKFDVILLNPPQTAGKDVCFEMIRQSCNQLNNLGTLQLVARHNKGGETLSKKMQEIFGNVKVLAKKGGYRVYASAKTS